MLFFLATESRSMPLPLLPGETLIPLLPWPANPAKIIL
jgi:hypothetical protein